MQTHAFILNLRSQAGFESDKEDKHVDINLSCNFIDILHLTFSCGAVPFFLALKGSNQLSLEAALSIAKFLGTPDEVFIELGNVRGYAIAVLPLAKGILVKHESHFLKDFWESIKFLTYAKIMESVSICFFPRQLFRDQT
ncbi:hypothetical protein AMTR_s00062p00156060 [Amborella trichopoda]|uniref:Uncharacterized protein n=1 Tax=Amborella trichopoda TaxID=13333 RepID=U5DAU8_AMBTC|nr:hypothetical protein AMTR_s00062p00156060 [Amborella trichopoda]